MNILFTICGRADSKGFENKNLKKMNGVPLVYYSLAAIKRYVANHPDGQVMVALNTDSSGLCDFVKSQSIVADIKVIDRKPELAGDSIAKVDVVKDTFLQLKDEMNIEAVVDLDITSPLRSAADIENAINKYNSNSGYDLVFSVVEARRSPYFNMVEKKDVYYGKICASNYTTRQETPQAYELNASIYVYSPEFLESEINNTILDNKCGISVMEDYLVLDIDSEEDFVMMELLHRYFMEKNHALREIYEIAQNIELSAS